MPIIILTKSPAAHFFSVEKWKLSVKKILGRSRGPRAVVASLVRGLRELNIAYKLNPQEKDINSDDVVWVNESLDTLRWGINAKKNGLIKSLYVGPNIVLVPVGDGEILLSPVIDKIIFPSQWTKDFFVSFNEAFIEKIDICPAGVALPDDEKKEIKFDVLVFVKHEEEKDLLSGVIENLKNNNLTYKLLYYGHFSQVEYYQLLNECRFMVYLTQSESQGIAMQEAWARNVPTLVWNRGYMQCCGHEWRDDEMSAPYLTSQCGAFFANENEFSKQLLEFINNLTSFAPREYVLKNLSDLVCAKKILTIMQEKL